MILANRNAINHYILMTIHIYKSLSLSVRQSVCHVLFVPRGTNIFTSRRWTNIFTHKGAHTFNVVDCGCHDDVGVDEVMHVSKANFLVSKANILVSEASKHSAGARILGARRALKF